MEAGRAFKTVSMYQTIRHCKLYVSHCKVCFRLFITCKLE